MTDIATKEVSSIEIDATIYRAEDMMYKSNHRHIIVIDGDKYFTLGIYSKLHIIREHQDMDVPLNSLDLKRVPTVNKRKNVSEMLEYLRDDFEQIVVLDDDGSLYGVITQSDILYCSKSKKETTG